MSCFTIQGEAEHQLENLNRQIESQLECLLTSDEEFSLDTFHEYRTKTIGLTAVTREYFKKLVEELEKNKWPGEREDSDREINMVDEVDGSD